MNPIRPWVAALSSLALLLAIAGCGRIDAPAVSGLAGGMQPPVRVASDPTRTAGAGAARDAKEASASQLAAGMADQLKDDAIAIKVTTGLAADRNLSALKIRVESQGGVVTLRGPAPTLAAKERAEEIARNVMGVTDVHNQLSVQAV